MNTDVLIQNIKTRCKALGITPTTACSDSGVSRSFISNLKKGQIPSVEKVQMLASYLGVSTSDLLGDATEDLVITAYHMPPQDSIESVLETLNIMSPEIIESFQSHTADSIEKLRETSAPPYTFIVEAKLQAIGGMKKSDTKNDVGLTEGEEALINLFRLLPSYQQEVVVQVVRTVADAK